MSAHTLQSPLTPRRPSHRGGRVLALDDVQIPALRLVRSSRWTRRMARWILVLMGGGAVLLGVAPWQQSVTGTGSVIAFAPRERQQPIEAPIEGRIKTWNERIMDNSPVTKGEFICEIQDIDPLLLSRLQDQLRATERSMETARTHLSANERNLEAAKTTVTAYESQVIAYTNVKEQTVAAAQDYLEMAQEKFSSEQKRLEEIEAELPQAKAQFLRQQKLADEKISSELKFQEAEFKYKALLAKVSKTQFDVAAANQEIEAKTRDREAKKEKAQADIEYATAMLRDATGKVAKAEADVAKSANEVAKAEKELSEMQSELARQHSQRVTAPMDGIVIDIVPNQGSQLVKSGETLCWIVPDTAARAVQLWVDGNDAALVEQGRRVRLQFEGWPAVQFSGWPSVAVGTFGGVVSSVDAFDDGQGNFRMVVIPDDTDEAWPDTRYLRQGVRANGWVLLDQVPLWYEVWRRMNGFPASTSQTPLKTQKGEASKKSKSPGEKTKSY